MSEKWLIILTLLLIQTSLFNCRAITNRVQRYASAYTLQDLDYAVPNFHADRAIDDVRLDEHINAHLVYNAPIPEANDYTNLHLKHRAVVLNAINEANLPAHLLNPFYKDHRIRSALGQSSWFAPGEKIVYDRQAEHVPRAMIYTMLAKAGLIHNHV